MRFRNRLVYTPPAAAAVPAVSPAGLSAVPAAASSSSPTLRQRYPFLDAPDCPMELHALVGHRISRYNEYTRLYAALADCRTTEECSDVARRLLEAYLDNRLCTDELNFYLRHRRIMGRHPMLRHFSQLAALRAMSVKELLKEQTKTRDNIWRVNSEIRRGDKPHLLERRQQKLQEYELKLREIRRLLGDD